MRAPCLNALPVRLRTSTSDSAKKLTQAFTLSCPLLKPQRASTEHKRMTTKHRSLSLIKIVAGIIISLVLLSGASVVIASYHVVDHKESPQNPVTASDIINTVLS